jgi:hypothetical protein
VAVAHRARKRRQVARGVLGWRQQEIVSVRVCLGDVQGTENPLNT